MDKIIYENVSLAYLINTLNTGIHGIEDLEMIGIFSKKRPGIVIKIMVIDIKEKIVQMMETGIGTLNLEQYKNNFDVETEVIDFIVFSVMEEENESDGLEENETNILTEKNSKGLLGLNSSIQDKYTKFNILNPFKPKTYVLVNMPLIEYVVIQETVAGDTNFLQSEEWNLIEFEFESEITDDLIEEN